MLRYVATRLLYMIPVLWLVVSVVFLLIHLVPGDPVAQMLGEGAASADIEAARHAYGLDVPIGQQYVNYWKGVLRGDLGNSLRLQQPVDTAANDLRADGRAGDIHSGGCAFCAPAQSLG
jgi:ABC-type dipeptide/oligopeptide/nickel transport system permease component